MPVHELQLFPDAVVSPPSPVALDLLGAQFFAMSAYALLQCETAGSSTRNVLGQDRGESRLRPSIVRIRLEGPPCSSSIDR